MRGLIVSTPIVFSDGGSFSLSAGGFSPQDLRLWLLFWDKLDFPKGESIVLGGGAEEDFLIDRGIMQRTKLRDDSIHITTGREDPYSQEFVRSHLDLLRDLNLSDKGGWALDISERGLHLPARELVEDKGFLVELTNALPVPDVDVPLEDVVDFKVRNHDLLLSLRAHLDGLYQGARHDPEKPFAENVALTKLEADLAHYMRANERKRWRYRLLDIQARFDLPGAARGALEAQRLGIDLQGIVAGALVGGASISLGPSFGLKEPTGASGPFGYVTKYRRELFGVG